MIKKPIIRYRIRKQTINTFTLTKLEDYEPVHTYTLIISPRSCECPGFQHHHVRCKHFALVNVFINRGMPDALWNIFSNGVVIQEKLVEG